NRRRHSADAQCHLVLALHWWSGPRACHLAIRGEILGLTVDIRQARRPVLQVCSCGTGLLACRLAASRPSSPSRWYSASAPRPPESSRPPSSTCYPPLPSHLSPRPQRTDSSRPAEWSATPDADPRGPPSAACNPAANTPRR